MFDTLTKGFKAARNRLSGVTELTEENIDQALRDVRLSLLEADVEFGVVKRFLGRVKERAVGEEVQTKIAVKGKKIKVGPAEQFIKICQDELEAMMASEGDAVVFAKKPKPTGIMMVGLQGAGKTTTAAKLARLLETEYERKPLLVAADVQRPGAIEQLQVLGEQINIPVFAIPGGRPLDICDRAVAHARKLKRDTIIYDTAGRLAIDETLMDELVAIKGKVHPNNIFLVIDAMIGQDSVKTAKAFHERLDISGVVLTKLDGDARGGAALSVKEVTGAPIRFAGMGEQMDKLEPFRAEGMASRILGFGDIVGLMKDFEGVVDEQKAEEDAKRMLQGQFTLEDFLEQIGTIQQMGPLQDIFEKLPFFADSVPEGFSLDDKELVKAKSIVSSMTRQERREVELFQKEPSRLRRVAKGSGRQEKDVADLLQRFGFMRQMMGNIGNQAGLLSKIPGMKQLAAARQLKSAVSTGGLEGNPMMANLADQLLEAAVADGGGSARGTSSSATRRRPVDKNKKKNLRKMKKKSKRKSRR
ncbi:MAG: signal recognition particle protein [Myxococcota bacterium]